MSFALLYAVILILWAVSWFAGWFNTYPLGNHFIVWLLFVLIGWQVYGPLIHP